MNITKYISKFLNRISLIGKITHLYRIKKAKKVLKKLIEISKDQNHEPKILLYLRKINPFVFEELILSVIENSNIRVIRNKRYTGDGGIDGIFKIKPGKVIIQCKRYQSYINNADVLELSNKVKEDKYYMGVFVHTGKTGTKAKDTFKSDANIKFISGSKLIRLVLNKDNIEDYLNKKY